MKCTQTRIGTLELIGSLMYLMVCTRPDIAHAAQRPSAVCGSWEAWGCPLESWTPGSGLPEEHTGSQAGSRGNSTSLVGYSDSSWADDLQDRKSSQGHCFSLGSGVISWKASRSPAVALSTCEAELYAACSASQEAVWLGEMLSLLGYPQDPLLLCGVTMRVLSPSPRRQPSLAGPNTLKPATTLYES